MRGREPVYYYEKKKPNWRTLGWLFLAILYATIYELNTVIYARVPVLVFVIFLTLVFFESIEKHGFTKLVMQPVKKRNVRRYTKLEDLK